MTCRHNDKKAKYCPVKKAHTDLGYVLNCIAWTPTDEAEMKRFRAENAKLRELVRWMYDRMDESCAAQYPYAPTPISYDRLMQALARARELGVEVD
jgi:hypothetical protein